MVQGAKEGSVERLRDALTGISGILVTPYDEDGEIAPSRLAGPVERALSAGVHALTINGNTSEFYCLSIAEAETMVHAATESVAGRAPVIAGIGRGVREACHLARVSSEAGASALMMLVTVCPLSSICETTPSAFQPLQISARWTG